MKRAISLSFILVFTLFGFSCSSGGGEKNLESAGQEWVITDSLTVNLELAQILPMDFQEEKKLFLGMNGPDYVIFDESGEIRHQIQKKTPGEPDYLGDWLLSLNFIGDDELLAIPNMSDEMFIIDYDGKVLEKIPTPYRIMVSISSINLRSYLLEGDRYLIYAPGRFTGMEMNEKGYTDPLLEIWDRSNNTFTPVLTLPEGHPYSLPAKDRYFPEFTYSEGKLILYQSSVPEIHLFQWDGTDFQFEQTIKPNFPKFVRYPEKADGSRDIRAVSAGRITHIDIDADALHIVYAEGIGEARYSTMSDEEKQMSEVTEPMYKVLTIGLEDLSERYQDLPQEVIPFFREAGVHRWMGLKNIYLKMEEEDFPTFYYLEKR